jgi:hypothetical protein
VDWQQIIALVIVATTAMALGWRWWRRRRNPLACGAGSCGCGGEDSTTDKPRITYRARKGQRPEILVKSG